MTSFKRHSYLNSYWSAPSVPPPTKKFVENVIDLSQYVEIDLSRFRQVSNIFCRRLFAFVGNMFSTCCCWKLVENMLQTMSKTCFRHVFDKIDLMEFGLYCRGGATVVVHYEASSSTLNNLNDHLTYSVGIS